MGDKQLCKKIKEERTVFLSKDNEVYRIPSLFYDRDNKIFMAFAEQRSTTNDADAKHLVMKTGTLKKEASTGVKIIEWSELKVVKEAHLDGHRPMNPCPVYEKTSKTLFLFFICVQDNFTESWQIKRCQNRAHLCNVTTKDGGQTWSSVTDLTHLPDINEWATFAVGPGHGLQTESGKLIIPTYAYPSNSTHGISRNCSVPHALTLYSDDKGSSWKFGKMLETKSVECEMAEVSDDAGHNYIYCNARSEGGYRVEAIDDGAGFKTLPSAGKLVETHGGCQGSVVSFPTVSEGATTDLSPNKWLLYTHPSDQSNRINLGVYLNKTPQDPNGWSKPWIINSGPSGYSDLAYIGDGWFACLMECGVQKYTEQIAYEVFHFSQVEKGALQEKNCFCCVCSCVCF